MLSFLQKLSPTPRYKINFVKELRISDGGKSPNTTIKLDRFIPDFPKIPDIGDTIHIHKKSLFKEKYPHEQIIFTAPTDVGKVTKRSFHYGTDIDVTIELQRSLLFVDTFYFLKLEHTQLRCLIEDIERIAYWFDASEYLGKPTEYKSIYELEVVLEIVKVLNPNNL
jgi:hypothetical protein